MVGPGRKEESGDVIEVEEEEERSSHIASFDGVGPDENPSMKNAGESDKVLVKCAQLIKEFRGMAATANYSSADRVDIQFSAKELRRSMAGPTRGSFKKLKHLARYLVLVPEVELFYENQAMPKEMDTHGDSDWAGCLGTRKSTSGGFAVLGKHLIKSWSSTQSTIALSSGEAGFYAIVEGASRSLGIKALMDDMGMEVEVVLKSDSSAGRAIRLRKVLER